MVEREEGLMFGVEGRTCRTTQARCLREVDCSVPSPPSMDFVWFSFYDKRTNRKRGKKVEVESRRRRSQWWCDV